MCEHSKKSGLTRIDPCLRTGIKIMNNNKFKTLASCCGHDKYATTIVADIKGFPVEIFSGLRIPRKKKFYKKDKQGRYHIPEVEKYWGD